MAVVRIEIEQRAVVLNGHTFGAAGAYEKLAGVVRFAVDRANPANHAITDLGLAPANARGHVEFWADFYLLRPADPARGNRRLLLDVPNRGRKVALGLFNSTPRVPDPSTPDDFGNGFLMRHGYTVAWCGWQHDVPRRDGLMALTVPAARANGPAITGLVRCEWRPNTRVTTLPLADRYHIPHPTIDLQDPGARLTVRERREAAAVEVERGAWRVSDAVVPHVAGARRGEFNHRFGQPSLNATHAVGSLFPFTDTVETDPLTGERGALLARLEGRVTLPKIFTINTSAEYWRGDASLVHTDIPGKRDVEPHPAARVYLFAGTQHTPGSLPPPDADPNTGGRGREPFNVVDYAPLLRAALVSLDRWVTEGVEPPASNVPRLADGTAVLAEVTAGVFTKIPGVRFPDRIERPVRLDFGPELARGIVTELPPKVGAPFVTFVSAVDADGNEIAGVRPVELLAPLATFTGWNPRHPTQGAPGDLMSMMGSTLPLPRTRAERLATGDPRRAIEERYPSRAAYLERVRAAALALVAARHVLAEDLDAIVERAGRLWDWVQARVT